MTVDRLLRDEESIGDFRVAKPLRDELQAPRARALSGSQGSSRVAGRGPCGSGEGAALAQPTSDDRPCGAGAETLQLGQSPTQGLVVVRVSQRQGGLVGAADPEQSSAARDHSPRIWSVYGSAASGGISSRIPARQRQQASSPIAHGARRRTAKSRAASVASATASCSPSSQAASARAAATGAIRGSSPVGSASTSASSSGGQTLGSPRRALTSPSTTRARVRGVVAMHRSPGARGLPSRPPRSSAPGRAPHGHDRQGGRGATDQSRARCIARARPRRNGSRARTTGAEGQPGQGVGRRARRAGGVLPVGRGRGSAPGSRDPRRPLQVLQRADADLGVAEDLGSRRGAARARSPVCPRPALLRRPRRECKAAERCCTPSRARVRARAARAELRPPGRIAPPRLLGRDTREAPRVRAVRRPRSRRSPSRR